MLRRKEKSMKWISTIVAMFLFQLTAFQMTLVTAGTKRVNKALEVIPEWLSEYISWHKQMRRENKLYDEETKYLIITCHSNRKSCTGFSDRLKSLPYFLLLARDLNRMIFIKWERFDLEDFFLPPNDGLDWRLPPKNIDIGKLPDIMKTHEILKFHQHPNHRLHAQRIVTIRPAGVNLYSWYESSHFQTPLAPHGTYVHVMNLLLDPVPALRFEIKKRLDQLKLIQKRYAAVHFRGPDRQYLKKDLHLYAQEEIDHVTKLEIQNSIACAQQISNHSMPIYFTSNYVNYIIFAKSIDNKVRGIDDVIRYHSAKPIRGFNFSASDPAILYPAFVDLWLLRLSKCVSYGKHGFGRFGLLMSGSDCGISHRDHVCSKK